jgi:hypothetical protein
MLYGTRKELNKKLKRMFGNEERYALLVWTKEDVMALSGNMTEAEAHTLLELIGRTGTGSTPKKACHSAPCRRCTPGFARAFPA